jgi:hypothetical protein
MWPFAMLAKLSLSTSSYTKVAKNVAGTLVRMAMGEYLSNASPPKKIAATIRVPKSRARFVAMVAPAKPHIMLPYASPMMNGALKGDTNGFAGSNTDQMTIPYTLLKTSIVERG